MKDAEKREVTDEFREMVLMWVERYPLLAAETIIEHIGVEFIVYGDKAGKQGAADIKVVADEANAAAKAAEVRALAEWEASLSERHGIDMRNPANWEKGDVVECITDGYEILTLGRKYDILFIGHESGGVIVTRADDGEEPYILSSAFKWIARP